MTTKHKNKVTMTASEFNAVNYISNSLVITSGQPSEEPASIVHTAPDWIITIDCGRKGSDAVGNEWVKATGGASNSFAPDGGGSPPPKKLNFYYGLTVSTVNGNSTTLYLGQGHYPNVNNWWVGGVDVTAIQNKAVLALGSGSTRETYAISGTHDSIVFTKR